MKGMRLAYRALELDAKDALGLRCLSDLFDGNGTEILSAIVLEYALAPTTGLPATAQCELDDLRFLAKWTWGFSRHKSGDSNLSGDTFKIRTDFMVDDIKYQAWIAEFIGRDTLDFAFKRAHAFAGAVSGLLTPVDQSASVGAVYTVRPSQFVQGSEYVAWLQEDTNEFDALELARQNHAVTNKKNIWKFW